MKTKKIVWMITGILLLQLFLFGCTSSDSGTLSESFFNQPVSEDDSPSPVVYKPSSISGHVLDRNTQKPVIGAKVMLEDYTITYTDINGYYSINKILFPDAEEVPKETVKVEADTYDTLEEEIAFPSGENIKTDFGLNRITASLSGLVTENGNPESRVRIQIGDENTFSNTNGYFSFSDLAPGNHFMKIYTGAILRYSTIIELEENHTDYNINLDKNSGSLTEVSSLSGVVRDEITNALLTDIIVKVSGYPAVSSGMDESGDGNDDTLKSYYKINNIPAGQRTVTFIDPSGNYYDFTKTLDLTEGENTFDVMLTPKPHTVNETSNITGIVISDEDNLLPEINITLRLYNEVTGEYIPFVSKSEEDGWFSFSDIPQGNYIMTAVDTNIPKLYKDYYIVDLEIDDGKYSMSIIMENQ
ncbi:MAG: carboxypeptidase-like regulatory domain-containing protein [Candidatus Muiribacteriota bacterium]